MIKILGGRYRSFALKVLDRPDLRPTSVMLRRRIFDSVQDLSGRHFVDLCAGTGSMGIEALSRNCASVVLNEKNHQIFNLLKKNVAALTAKDPSCSEQMQLSSQNFLDCLKNLTPIAEERILFFDPPYENEKMYQAFALYCMEHPQLYSELWVEGEVAKLMPSEKLREYFHFLSECKVYNQGTNYLLILKKG